LLLVRFLDPKLVGAFRGQAGLELVEAAQRLDRLRPEFES
jgi:hypothetical protein